MSKTVLLTGVSGFAGSHIAEHILVNTDWNIVGLATFRHRGDSIRFDGFKDSSRIKIHYHDLQGPLSSRLIDRIGHVDYVLNVASESHVDRSITDPAPFVENNVRLVLNMLEFARQAKPDAFMQISTDEVYGPAPENHRHKEWETYLPSNPYSASKAAQEAIAISYWRTFGVPVVITNTMNLIGERQDSEKFIPMVIRRVARGERVSIHGDTERGIVGSRFYLHARNHADALLFLIRNTTPSRYPDTDRPDRYNVVGEREVDNLTMAQMIAGFAGKPLDYFIESFHRSRPGHDLRYALDGSKIAALGWTAPIPLEASLRRTVEWTIEHSEWLK